MVTFWSQFTLIKGWAEMIRKVYEVDPLRCFCCGSDHQSPQVDLCRQAPRPPQAAFQELLMAVDPLVEYF